MKILAFSLLLLSIASSMSCGGGVNCGPDTEAVEGVCVNQRVDPECAEGTRFVAESKECRALLECGRGTHLDATLGACVADARCGGGTLYNEQNGLCEAEFDCSDTTVLDEDSRNCVSSRTCGEGAELSDDDECVLIDICGQGTVRHPFRGVCVPDVLCGEGLVAIEGVCRQADDLLREVADFVESRNDNNDPSFGGSASGLTLEVIGESTVVVGNISRPVDLDSDGEFDQDHDFFHFEGIAGQVLEIRVLDAGLPMPGFIVRGPRGYFRSSRQGVVTEAKRDLMLSENGRYEIEIAPLNHLGDDDDAPPIGSPDHDYIMVISEKMPPSPREVRPIEGPEEETLSSGSLQLSAISIADAAQQAVLVRGLTADKHTEPELLVVSATRGVLGRVPFDSDASAFDCATGVWPDEQGLMVVIDWVRSDGFETLLTLGFSKVREFEGVSLAADASLSLPATTLTGGFAQAFSFESAPNQLVSFYSDGPTSPVVSLQSDAGRLTTNERRSRLVHHYNEPGGRVRAMVINTRTSDVTLSAGVSLSTPLFLGDLTPDVESLSRSEINLGPGYFVGERALYIFEHSEDVDLRFDFDFERGIPDFALFSLEGSALLNEQRLGEDDVLTLRGARRSGERTLLMIDPAQVFSPNPFVQNASFRVQSEDWLTSQDANESVADATAISLDEVLQGQLRRGEFDHYRLELDDALSANEALLVQVTPEGNQSVKIGLLDAAEELLISKARARSSRLYLFADDIAQNANLVLSSTSSQGDFSYQISVEKVLNAALDQGEVPNTAEELSDDGRHLRIGKVSGDELDFFVAERASPFELRAHNVAGGDDLEIVRYEGALEGATTVHEDARMVFEAGRHVFAIKGRSPSRVDFYEIDLLPSVANVSDKSTEGLAHLIALADEGVSVRAQKPRGEDDFYRVRFHPPLAQGESLKVQFENTLERADLIVELLSQGNSLAVVEDHVGELVAASQDDIFVRVQPDGNSLRQDIYEINFERVAVASEREPNNNIQEANTLTLPTSLQSQSNVNDPDVYRVLTPLGASNLNLEAQSLLKPRLLTVRVLSSSEEVLYEGVGLELSADLEVDSQSTYFIEVTSAVGVRGEHGEYSLSLR